MGTPVTIKIGLPAENTRTSFKLSVSSESTIQQVIQEVVKLNKIERLDDYMIYSNTEPIQWLKLDKKVKDYNLNNESLLTLQNKYYFADVCYYINPKTLFHRRIILNITVPFSTLHPFLLYKFHLNPMAKLCILSLSPDDSFDKIIIDKSLVNQNVSQDCKIFIVEEGKDLFSYVANISENLQSKASTLNISGVININRKKRWVSVENNFLLIYKVYEDGKYKIPIETVNLTEYYYEFDEKDKRKQSFDLLPYTHPKVNYTLKFSSEQETMSWFNILKQVCVVDVKKKSQKNLYFGAPIGRVVTPQNPIPILVQNCVNYIRAKGLKIEGIFRLSGTQNEIDDLKSQYNSGNYVNLSDVADLHVVSGLLKAYLRDLPEPLITYELYDFFLNAHSEPDELKKINLYRQLIWYLPRTNYVTLDYLISFLYEVSSYAALNKMAVNNLATVFGPNLLHSKYKYNALLNIQDTPIVNSIVCSFITNYDLIFSKYLPVLYNSNSYKAIHDYDCDKTNHLNFKINEIVTVIKKDNSKGWWIGQKDKVTGIFPGSYVEEVPLTKKQKFVLEFEHIKNRLRSQTQQLKALRIRKNILLKELKKLDDIESESKVEKAKIEKVIKKLVECPAFEDFKKELENIYLYLEKCNNTISCVNKNRLEFLNELASLSMLNTSEQRKKQTEVTAELSEIIYSKLIDEKNLRVCLQKINDEFLRNLSECIVNIK